MNLLVPTLGLDVSLLNRLIASLDFPIEKKALILNAPESEAMRAWSSGHRDWSIINHPRNLGVAGSWNLAPKLWPDDPAWLIVNDDYAFLPGYLKALCECADQHATQEPIIFMHQNAKPSWPCFVWTRKGVTEFGTFDENFWPAYYEDCDMMIRHRIAEVKYRSTIESDAPQAHGKPATGKSYNSMIETLNDSNRAYWLTKWGNSDYFGKPAWETPFGLTHSVSFWELDKARRALAQSIFDAFIASPTASLYS